MHEYTELPENQSEKAPFFIPTQNGKSSCKGVYAFSAGVRYVFLGKARQKVLKNPKFLCLPYNSVRCFV